MDEPLGSASLESPPSLNWIPVCLGLAWLYIPTYLNLYRLFWLTREGLYGPIMLAFVVWLVWRERAVLRPTGARTAPVLGGVLFALGLVAYILGRSQSFYNLEVISQIPLLLGIVCLLLGRSGLARLWFPIALLVFVVPIPASLLDQILLPLKESVSRIVDDLLYAAGYPIARNGVVLMIGPYSLLIADACAGLNSIIAISGIGLIYTYVAGHSNWWINGALLLSAVPIAFVANVVRVSALVLITYYFGDEVGSSFHEQAGYLEVAVAFAAFFALDGLLGRIHRRLIAARPGTA